MCGSRIVHDAPGVCAVHSIVLLSKSNSSAILTRFVFYFLMAESQFWLQAISGLPTTWSSISPFTVEDLSEFKSCYLVYKRLILCFTVLHTITLAPLFTSELNPDLFPNT